MEVKRSGSQPSSKGPVEYFTGSVRIELALPRQRARARRRRVRHFRARCAHRVAHASIGSNADCRVRVRLGAERRCAERGNPPRRRGVDPSRRKALARRYRHHCNDPHRHCGSSRWSERRLDGKGQRRTIREVNPASRKVRARYPSAEKIGAISHGTALCVSGLPSLPGSVRKVGTPWGKGWNNSPTQLKKSMN